MASKGKSRPGRQSKPQMPETTLIDMKRFAYDVIVHSVSKFGVPKGCIEKWPGSENNYGCPNYCTAIFRVILEHQMSLRYELHKKFNLWYESNESDKSQEWVKYLLKDAIKNIKVEIDTGYQGKRPKKSILNVEISLSVACELVIFLYSKNKNLKVKDLADNLFSDHFRLEKKKFKKAGGLEALYGKGNFKNAKCFDSFHDAIISKHCHPYEDSAKVQRLGNILYQLTVGFKKALEENNNLRCEDSPRLTYIVDGSTNIVVGSTYIAELSIEFLPPPETSRRDEASGIDLLENPGLGISPHEEMLRNVLPSPAGTTASQNLLGASSLETAKHRRTPSDTQKSRKSRYSLSSSRDHGLGQVSLHSSGTKQSSEKKSKDSVVHDPTPAQKSPGTSSQELAMHLGQLSGFQKSKISLCSSLEQSVGQLSLESSATKQSSEKKPNVSVTGDPESPQILPGASSQESAKKRRVKSQNKNKSKSRSNDDEEE